MRNQKIYKEIEKYLQNNIKYWQLITKLNIKHAQQNKF